MFYQPHYYIQPVNHGWPISTPIMAPVIAEQPSHVYAPYVCVHDGQQLHCYNQPYIEWIPAFPAVANCAYPMYMEPNVATLNPMAQYYPAYSPAPPPPAPHIPSQSLPTPTPTAVNDAHRMPCNGSSGESCPDGCRACEISEFRDIEAVLVENPEYPHLMFLNELDYSLSMAACECEYCFYAPFALSETTTDTDYSCSMCSCGCSSMDMTYIDWTVDSTEPPSVITSSYIADDDDGTVINDPELLHKQIQMMTSTPVRVFKCVECAQLYPSHDALCRHIAELLLNTHDCSHSETRFDDQSIGKQKKSHTCNGCNKSFDRYNQLVQHGFNCNFKLFITTAMS